MKISHLILAGALAVGTVGASLEPAIAQSIDPAAMPQAPALVTAQTSGTITRYFVGPMGHVRGFVLDNGAVVFVHGRSGDAMAQQVPVGQQVRIDGFAHANTPTVIRRATVYGANGNVVAAAPQGQPGAGMGQRGWQHRGMNHSGGGGARFAQLPQRTTSAVVQTLIPGPRGHIRIALLSDGTSVYFNGPIAREVNQHGLHVGESLQVAGRGEANQAGAAIMAEHVTFADGATATAPAPATFAPGAAGIAPAVP